MPSLYRVPPENPIKFIFLMLQIKKLKLKLELMTLHRARLFFGCCFWFCFHFHLSPKLRKSFSIVMFFFFFFGWCCLFFCLDSDLLKDKKMDKFYYNCYKITSQYHLPKASQKLLASSGILPCLLSFFCFKASSGNFSNKNFKSPLSNWLSYVGTSLPWNQASCSRFSMT